MSLTPSGTTQIADPERMQAMLRKVGSDCGEIFRQFRDELGGRLPAELSYGMVAGYLRGRGHTWEEAMAGMGRYIQIMQPYVSKESVDGKVTILGKQDGAATVGIQIDQPTS